jgi:hypothetical protein
MSIFSVFKIKMSSAATLYREEHARYYAQERIKDRERVKKLYHNNPE